MITPVCQRWQLHHSSYRLAGERWINTHEYDVVQLNGNRDCKAFVEQHHYSGSYPSDRCRFGLYHRSGELVGVVVYSQPWEHVVSALLGDLVGSHAQDVVELGRLVLLDSVAANAESWFVAQTFAALRSAGYAAVISMSDPVPRMAQSGSLVFPGHIGVVYQALNACYLGRSVPRSLRLLHDGSVLNERLVQKIARGERGWRYGVERLVRAGADEPGEDLVAWLNHWLPTLTRKLPHSGNHRYAWLMSRHLHARALAPRGQKYPKWGW